MSNTQLVRVGLRSWTFHLGSPEQRTTQCGADKKRTRSVFRVTDAGMLVSHKYCRKCFPNGKFEL